MARHGPQSHDQPLQEEDYIDMDLSSPAAAQAVTARASLLCYSTAMAASSQNSREFEFHMSAPVDKWEPMASPADELFYKGKLLPLHLPPRIQMVEKLLESAAEKGLLSASTAPATPYQSCNVSPANSCYVSGELNAEHYFHECTSAGIGAEEEEAACEKKTWSRKLKFIRHLNLGLKLKASKAYLKTIFATKGGNTDSKTGTPAANELSHAQFKSWRKNPFGQIRSNRYISSPISNSLALGGKLKEDEFGHRRSFSSVIIRCSSSTSNKTSSASTSSCSSSNSSSSILSSNDSGVGPVLRRSSSASSEMDNPIQGAIAYCKKSQQLASVRKSASDAGFRFMSSSASRIAAESEDSDDIIEICRR
ncbi:probable membrane-associated kinase regulator 4 [Oryza brachyantha]|uniref:Membrane-associated kinase regulator 4 n=1 Tax=Oryza brachyantha TaxID=4533 RepID=J3L5L8_ORYBR|nr:probable membrane-associated kinase regulator 4 [Oryza brachyantha]